MLVKDFFERTYVINLPERVDRRKEMIHELDKAGLSLTPNKIEIFPAIRPESAENFPSISIRGCFSSHLRILKQAKRDGLANVLVMEDDLTIAKKFVPNQSAIVEQLSQSDWGFVYLGHRQEVSKDTPVKLQPFPANEWILTTHFYGVNSTIFDRLINFLEESQRRPADHPQGGATYPDWAYSYFRAQNPDVVTLIAAPNLGWQRSSRSDLHGTAWYDTTPVVRDLVGVARSGKVWLTNLQDKS